jgi:acetone carboxylase gamma subunit
MEKINKCPMCKLQDLTLVDSSENITYPSPEIKSQMAEWEEYECQNCGVLLEVENGYITVKRIVGLEAKTIFRFTINWEKKIEESYNNV